jgi:hypothetical protein
VDHERRRFHEFSANEDNASHIALTRFRMVHELNDCIDNDAGYTGIGFAISLNFDMCAIYRKR